MIFNLQAMTFSFLLIKVIGRLLISGGIQFAYENGGVYNSIYGLKIILFGRKNGVSNLDTIEFNNRESKIDS